MGHQSFQKCPKSGTALLESTQEEVSILGFWVNAVLAEVGKSRKQLSPKA